MPWRNEQELVNAGSYMQTYQDNLPNLSAKRSSVEQHSEVIEDALDRMEEVGPPVHTWDDIAPHVEQERHEFQS